MFRLFFAVTGLTCYGIAWTGHWDGYIGNSALTPVQRMWCWITGSILVALALVNVIRLP